MDLICLDLREATSYLTCISENNFTSADITRTVVSPKKT